MEEINANWSTNFEVSLLKNEIMLIGYMRVWKSDRSLNFYQVAPHLAEREHRPTCQLEEKTLFGVAT